MSTVKIGVIGAGKWGINHVRIYSEINECKLIGLADINSKAEEIAKEHNVEFFQDYNELFPLVDAVSVVVPTDKHYEVVKDALNAGKHVMVEKPVTLESKQASELVKLAEEKNLILSVGYLFRYNPAVIKLKEIIKDAGKIQYITARYIHSTKPPRKDSGVVLNLGIHIIDILNFILEERPNKVYCKKINLLDKNLEDSSTVILDYGDFLASLELSCCHPLKKRDIWIIAEKEKVYVDLFDQKITRYPLIVNYEEVIAKKEENIEVQKNEPLKEELKDFASNILKHNDEEYEKIINIGKEEYYTTRICELALKSAEFNRDLDVE